MKCEWQRINLQLTKLKRYFPHTDNAKEMIALESKCEKLSAQVERLTTEKEIAYEEIRRLEDQVTFYYPTFILISTVSLLHSILATNFSRFFKT